MIYIGRWQTIIEFSVTHWIFSTWVKAALGSGLAAIDTLQAMTTRIGGMCMPMDYAPRSS